MSYLWGFINSLTVQSYLIYLNINFPVNVVNLFSYFNVINNGIPALNNYIPDASNYLVNKDIIELPEFYNELPAKFNEMNGGVEIFLVVNYGRTITLELVAVFIFIPFLLAVN